MQKGGAMEPSARGSLQYQKVPTLAGQQCEHGTNELSLVKRHSIYHCTSETGGEQRDRWPIEKREAVTGERRQKPIVF